MQRRLGGLPLASRVTAKQIVAGLKSYPGLPHRQERSPRSATYLRQRQQGDQRRRHGARFGLSYRNIYWIWRPGEGGRRDAACALVSTHPPRLPDRRGDRAVRHQLGGKVVFDRWGDLQSALTAAHYAGAARGCKEKRHAVVVLLSPACARGQWKSYEHAAMRSAPWRRGVARRADLGGEQRDPGTARRPQRDRQWWWTVDRWSLGAILAIMAFGVLLTLAASPPAAERIGADSSCSQAPVPVPAMALC